MGAVERWISAHAVEIDLDGRGSLDAFGALDEIAADARLAFVVESHHFIHEKYAFRLLVLRYLASRGWRWFGEELGWADGRCIDEFLRTGDVGALGRVPTYGYEGVRRADRDDRPWGILKGGDDSDPTDELRFEQCRFARDVRETIPGARWFGFDVDGWTTASLGALPAHPALEQVPGESLDEEAARVAAFASSPDASRLTSADRRSLDALASTLHYATLAYPAPTYEALQEPMAVREELIHRHVDAALDDPEWAGPDQRVALMAGSLHLVKDDDAVGGATSGVGPGGRRVRSIGHHVAHRDDVGPAGVLSIWMLCGRGRDSNPLVRDQQEIAPTRGTLNRALAKASDGVPILVPTAGFPGRATVQHMYNATFDVPLADQLDAIVFAPDVTPLQSPP